MYIKSEIQKSLSCKKSIFQRHEVSRNILKQGRRRLWGWGAIAPQFLKNAKNALSEITKIPTSYFYLIHPLEEKFDALKYIILHQNLLIVHFVIH